VLHQVSYALSRLGCQIILAPFVRFHIIGLEQIPRAGRLILASNHISHFDPPVLTATLRRKIDWMGMTELFSNRLAAAWLYSVDCFPVDRSRVDRAAVRTALDRLKQERIVGIFPEGGIRDGSASVLCGAPMRAGIGAIAQLGDAPVIPCALLGSDRLYSPRAWIPRRRVNVYLAFGAPLHCEGREKGVREQFEADLGDRLRALLTLLQKRFQLTENDLPHSPQERARERF
jgi:1-acyl-sn-glycerol-3-phosphate acyltransferase